MDDWGWQELEPWLSARVALPIGPLFCVINGRTRGRPWTTSGARAELRRAAARAAMRRRFAPHQLRHAHAVEMARKASRSSSSNASSGTATSGSPRSICRASTTPRSSRRSTRAAPQWCRSPPRGRPCRPRRTENRGPRARASAPTTEGPAPAHSSAAAATGNRRAPRTRLREQADAVAQRLLVVRRERLGVDPPDARCTAGGCPAQGLMVRLVGVAAVWGRAARGSALRWGSDHVIVAPADLDAAAARLGAEHGLALPGAGDTTALGTHNRSVPLGGCYVEILARGRQRRGSAVSARAGAGRPHRADRRGTRSCGLLPLMTWCSWPSDSARR
jgi:hypothetical protein